MGTRLLGAADRLPARARCWRSARSPRPTSRSSPSPTTRRSRSSAFWPPRAPSSVCAGWRQRRVPNPCGSIRARVGEEEGTHASDAGRSVHLGSGGGSVGSGAGADAGAAGRASVLRARHARDGQASATRRSRPTAGASPSPCAPSTSRRTAGAPTCGSSAWTATGLRRLTDPRGERLQPALVARRPLRSTSCPPARARARSGGSRCDGGEAEQVTDLPLDVGDLRALARRPGASPSPWRSSPTATSRECTRERLTPWPRARPAARVYDRLFFRHWDTWEDGKRSHVFVLPDRRAATRGRRDARAWTPTPPPSPSAAPRSSPSRPTASEPRLRRPRRRPRGGLVHEPRPVRAPGRRLARRRAT